MDTKERMVQALKDAITETFKNTLSLSPVVTHVNGEDLAAIVTGKSVVASIGFTGRMEGTLVVVFGDDAARKTVSRMLGADLADLTQDVFDGIGEIANILAGGVIRRMAKEGDHFQISIPSVVHVDNPLSIIQWDHADTIQMAVDCGVLKFAVSSAYIFDKKFGKDGQGAPSEEKQKIAEKYLKNLIE